jgi:hypothetical protein
MAQATPQQIAAVNQQHLPPTPQQTRSTCKWRRKIRRCRSTTIKAIPPLRRPHTRRDAVGRICSTTYFALFEEHAALLDRAGFQSKSMMRRERRDVTSPATGG